MAEVPFKQELETALKNQLICPAVANNSALTFAAREALRSATGIDLPFNQASNAIQAAFCPLPSNSPIPPTPSGGQCPTLYRLDWQYSREVLLTNGDWESQTLSGLVGVQGPITFLGITVVESSNGSPCGTANRQITYRVQNGSGSVINVWSDSEFNCGPFTGGRRNIQPGTIAVSRVDGQPDNCGNSPLPPAPLPIPPGGLPQPPFTLPVGDKSYNISPRILVPFVNPKGELNVPVNVDIGGINIDFDLNLDVTFNVSTGDIKFDFSKPSGTRDPGKNSPRGNAPDSPVSIPVDSSKEPKRKQRLIGAIATAGGTSIPQSLTAISLPGETPTVFAPYLGYVNFVYEFANGNRAFSPDIPIKNRRQFVPAPEPLENVINVIGSGNRGIVLSVTPVYQNEE